MPARIGCRSSTAGSAMPPTSADAGRAATTVPLGGQPSSRALAVVPATVPVAGPASGIAVDQATGTLYVTSPDPSLVTVISTSTCSARDVPRCAGHLTVTRGGVDPLEPAGDQASHTLYLVDGGENTVSMINTAACNAARVTGCGQVPA